MRTFLKLSALFCLLSAPAMAQATRTWVSGVGDDANPCSRTAPCKTLAGTISKTAAGGEINAIDSGGFGAVTITKAITIDLHNVLGGILVSATPGITVNAGVNDVVVLRGMDLFGVNSATKAVNFLQGKALHIEDSTIANFDMGVDMPATNVGTLFVKNVTITNTVTAGLNLGSGTTALTGGKAIIDHSRILSSAIGVDVKSAAKATVHDVVIADCTIQGLHAQDTADITFERGVISHNGIGAKGDGTSVVRLSDVLVGNNASGILGTVSSFGNNRLAAGNGTAGTPAATLPLQ